jgi:hypothetical protein
MDDADKEKKTRIAPIIANSERTRLIRDNSRNSRQSRFFPSVFIRVIRG